MAASKDIAADGEAKELRLYLRGLRKTTAFSASDEHELALLAQAGDARARRALVESHLMLVVALAKQQLGRGVALADLVEEGNLSLIEAAARFEPVAGASFASFASSWVRHALEHAVAQNARLVRLPVQVLRDLRAVQRAQRHLQAHGQASDVRAVAAHLGRDLLAVEELLQWTQPTESLDDRPGGGEGAADTTGDVRASGLDGLHALFSLPDTDEHHDPESLRFSHELREQALACLRWLSPREREVLSARFGLATGAPKTLEEVAQDMGCTRERVRQMQHEAVHKLRQVLQRQGVGPEAFF